MVTSAAKQGPGRAAESLDRLLEKRTAWRATAERLFAAQTDKQLRRGVHRSTRELEDAIRSYIEIPNARPKLFVWTKTADPVLASATRSCYRISDSGH